MRRPVPALQVSAGQREVLESLARSQSGAASRGGAGQGVVDGGRRSGQHGYRAVVVGVAGVGEELARPVRRGGSGKFAQVREGRGRKPSIPQDKIDEIVDLTQNYRPEGETHWSCRTMAAAAGVSKSTVQQVWSARGLKPHRVETFKLSNDPKFEEKLVDVVGLYLNPPEKAIVLCADEKSSVQALDRTQASLPMVKGRGETMTHDYKRHGTTTLFAALDVLTGMIISQCMPRHRHQEWLKFLKTIDREVPKDLQIHLILRQLRHPQARRRPQVAGQAPPVPPALHPDILVVAQPRRTLVSGTDRQSVAARRLPFRARPVASIQEYIDAHNDDPRPYVWTATAESILAKVARGRIALEKVS